MRYGAEVPPSAIVTPAATISPDRSDTELLRTAGLRVTAHRLAVLEAVREGGHQSVEQIEARTRAALGAISNQAVYDVLGVLARAGLVRRIEPAGSPARYETRVGDNHHHVVCRSCGAIADVDCAVGHSPCLEPSTSEGFVIDEAEVTFWGLCPVCAAATTKPLISNHHDGGT